MSSAPFVTAASSPEGPGGGSLPTRRTSYSLEPVPYRISRSPERRPDRQPRTPRRQPLRKRLAGPAGPSKVPCARSSRPGGPSTRASTPRVIRADACLRGRRGFLRQKGILEGARVRAAEALRDQTLRDDEDVDDVADRREERGRAGAEPGRRRPDVTRIGLVDAVPKTSSGGDQTSRKLASWTRSPRRRFGENSRAGRNARTTDRGPRSATAALKPGSFSIWCHHQLGT